MFMKYIGFPISISILLSFPKLFVHNKVISLSLEFFLHDMPLLFKSEYGSANIYKKSPVSSHCKCQESHILQLKPAIWKNHLEPLCHQQLHFDHTIFWILIHVALKCEIQPFEALKFSIPFSAAVSGSFSCRWFHWLKFVILKLDDTNHTKELPYLCILILNQFFVFSPKCHIYQTASWFRLFLKL